jgi:hypothetical protein
MQATYIHALRIPFNPLSVSPAGATGLCHFSTNNQAKIWHSDHQIGGHEFCQLWLPKFTKVAKERGHQAN